jgi:hypothetical protein
MHKYASILHISQLNHLSQLNNYACSAYRVIYFSIYSQLMRCLQCLMIYNLQNQNEYVSTKSPAPNSKCECGSVQKVQDLHCTASERAECGAAEESENGSGRVDSVLRARQSPSLLASVRQARARDVSNGSRSTL